MRVAWQKLGRVYCAQREHPWAISHAYCPTAFLREDGERIRVLCAFLDAERVGRCGWVDLDTAYPERKVAVADAPVLDVGASGTFDEHGVRPLSIARLDDGRLRLYYAGWQRGVGVRYTLFTGAAERFDFGISNERDGTLNPGLMRNKEGFGARAVVHDRYVLELG